MIQEHHAIAQKITEQLYQICWYMRGSISREEAFALSPKEREMIWKLIEKNFELTKKTGMAFI